MKNVHVGLKIVGYSRRTGLGIIKNVDIFLHRSLKTFYTSAFYTSASAFSTSG